MQLEGCKAPGEESGFNCFVPLTPLWVRDSSLHPTTLRGQDPSHGNGKGTGLYRAGSQGTGGLQLWSQALLEEAKALISALPPLELGMLGAVPGRGMR